MGTFLIALITGVAAGAFTARTIVRRELDRLPKPQAATTPPPVVAAPPPVVAAPPPLVAAPPPPAPPEEITPEILVVLTAAVAAFLGKTAKIRSARVSPVRMTSAWAQQGRVFVQASHNLPAPHGARQ